MYFLLSFNISEVMHNIPIMAVSDWKMEKQIVSFSSVASIKAHYEAAADDKNHKICILFLHLG